MRNLKPLSIYVFFFALAFERTFIETNSIESRCYRTWKYTVCRRVRAIIQPGYVTCWGSEGYVTCWGSEGKLEREEKSETRITASILRHTMFIVSHLVHVIRKQQLNQRKISSFFSHLIFHCFNRLTVVYVSFCSMTKRITPKICRLCVSVVINNLSCVWIERKDPNT